MPVIRGKPIGKVLAPEERKKLSEAIALELGGAAPAGGPVVYEIPLDLRGRKDVLVIWDGFQEVPSEERTNVILDAYGEDKSSIVQALGATLGEAEQQHLLPYSIMPLVKKGEATPDDVKAAMRDAGAIEIGDRLILRFPTQELAQQTWQELQGKFPDIPFSLAQSLVPFE